MKTSHRWTALLAVLLLPGPGILRASAIVTSYLNLTQLWIALRRDGIYVSQPGWAKHLARLGAACAAMVAVLLFGLWHWSDWSDWATSVRVLRLAVLIGGAGAVFVAVLFACGFRVRDLRAH